MQDGTQLWAKYAGGGKAVADLNRLLTHYDGLLRSRCRTTWLRLDRSLRDWMDLDDLLQAGRLALAKAIEAYDPQICPSIEPFLTQRINWALRDHMANAQASLRRGGHQVSLDTIVERPADDVDPDRHIDGALIWEKSMRGLSDIEAKVVRLRFQDGLDFKSIGIQVEKSTEQARRIYNEALRRIRSRLAGQEEELLGRRRSGSGPNQTSTSPEEHSTPLIEITA